MNYFDLETMKFGLLLSVIPFSLIFLLITIAWALVDLSLREVTLSRRVMWTLVVIALPLAGPIAYNYLVRRSTAYKKLSLDKATGKLCSAVK